MSEHFHSPGLAYVPEVKEVVYIPIPKCASTTIRTLEGFNFKQRFLSTSEIEGLSSFRFFAVVRHPVDRWVAAYLESRLRAYNNVFLDYPFEADLRQSIQGCLKALDNHLFDPHFTAQCDLLRPFGRRGVDLLSFDDLDRQLMRLFDEKYSIDLKIEIPRKKVYNQAASRLSSIRPATIKELAYYLLCLWLAPRKLGVQTRRNMLVKFRMLGTKLSAFDLMPTREEVDRVVKQHFHAQIAEYYSEDVQLYAQLLTAGGMTSNYHVAT